jgi:acyl carrier protein
MDVEQIKQTLRSHIVREYRIQSDDTEFTDDVHLFDYGYIDSMGAVALVSFVQSTFEMVISHADLTAYPLNTINEISTFVSLRQQGEL